MTGVAWLLIGVALTLVTFWIGARWVGFRSQRPALYDDIAPCFALGDVLTGDLVCDGVIYGPLGRVVSRFTADISMHWDGNRARMAERFRYDSGTVLDREWWLEILEDGAVRADADDLVDTGHGQQTGGGFVMNYRIRLPVSAGGHVLNVTDWMYLTPGGVIVNRSQFRKFGIKVAELVATIRRTEAT